MSNRKTASLTAAEQRELAGKVWELLDKINKAEPTKKFRLAASEEAAIIAEPKVKRKSLLREKVDTIFGKGFFSNVYHLFRILHKLYKHSKSKDDSKFSTHQFITEKAMDLLLIQDAKTRGIFLKGCVRPDEFLSDMFDLFQEGHFYGPINGQFGNYITLYFGEKVVPSLLKIKTAIFQGEEDIHENALNNFNTHYRQYLTERDLKEMAISVHFLQDMTAPHHIRNIPSFLPKRDKDTHVQFERKAKTVLKNNPPKFTIDEYNSFKDQLTTTPQRNPKDFANQVREKAWPFAQRIENKDEWGNIVKGTIPIAVYATARVYETMK